MGQEEALVPAFQHPEVLAWMGRIELAVQGLGAEANQQEQGAAVLIAMHCYAAAVAAQSAETLEQSRDLDELCRNAARGTWLTIIAKRFPDSAEAVAGKIYAVGKAMEEDGLKPQWPGDRR